jgi:parvulin-like peptidyl-prolyl isomerase
MRTASALSLLAALVPPLVLVAPAPALAEEVDRIVLRVNDKIATLAQYVDRRDTRMAAVARAADLPADERRKLASEAGRSAMREIFEELLVLSRAQQMRLEASPAEIDRAVDNARRRFGVTTDEELAKGLAESGSSMAEFRARMAQNLLFNQVLQREIQPRIKIDDEDVARYWREHADEFNVAERRKVEELVVRESAAPTPEARRALAAALRDLLVEGKSIADAVAAKGAADSTLVLDHGWIERGTLDAQLETTVWELAAGGVGGPIEGRGGLHVLRLIEIQPAKVRPLDEVRPDITSKLQEARFESESAKYLDELAAKAYVVENLPPDAVGYRTASAGERDPVRELMRGERPKDEKAPAAESQPEAAPSNPAPPPAQLRRK